MKETMHTITTWYRSNFETFEKSLNGEADSSIHRARKSALDRFAELGFPTTKQEDWRFTNVAPIAETQFQPILASEREGLRPEQFRRYTFGGSKAIRCVFVNGHFSKELSTAGRLPSGVVSGSLADAIRTHGDLVQSHLGRLSPLDDGFTALNSAFLQDGAFLFVPDGKVIEDPIQLIYISTERSEPFTSQPRNLIVTGKNCQAAFIESYVGIGDNVYLTNSLTEIVVGERSVVEHDKLQHESIKGFHVGTINVRLAERSNYLSNSVAIGGSLVRNTINVTFDGEWAEATLNGLSLGTGSQVIDNHTVIDHARANCASHELYKAVLDGGARGVFNGKIFVRKDAQKTDAKQTNKTLLLSDKATMDTKPQLEIFADDVKCTHGATVGQLDAEQVFYLRSRGIDSGEARSILTFAFAADVVERIRVEGLRNEVQPLVHEKLIEVQPSNGV
ncbi:MAG: Fe-S cluster assembly protein SufD [Bacteroidota bacterium]